MTTPSSFRILRSTILLALALAFAATMAGCYSSPENVVINFYDHVMKGDWDGAKRYMSKRLQTQTSSIQSAVNMSNPNNPMAGGQPDTGRSGKNQHFYKKEDLGSEISSKEAKVWLKQSEWMKLVLIKESGAWKIDSFDLDYKGMADALQKSLDGLPPEVRDKMPAMPAMPGQ
jgi:hypothetical protein